MKLAIYHDIEFVHVNVDYMQVFAIIDNVATVINVDDELE